LNIRQLGFQLPFAIHPILRQVRAKVRSGRNLPWLVDAWVGDLEERAGLGIALTKEEKIVGKRLRKDD
jgi:hypothetical protein